MTTEEALIKICQLREKKHYKQPIGATLFEIKQQCGLPLQAVLADLAAMRESGIVNIVKGGVYSFKDPMYYNPANVANRKENAEMPY